MRMNSVGYEEQEGPPDLDGIAVTGPGGGPLGSSPFDWLKATESGGALLSPIFYSGTMTPR